MSEKGGDHQHKVRFDQNEENNAISVERQIEPENSFIVHLGFLKINHYYAIEFPILKSQLSSSPAILSDISKAKNTAHCKLIAVRSLPTEFLFQIELYAHTESLLTETIVSPNLELNFVAQVLGKNKGTPLVKDGIHILHTSHPSHPHLNADNLDDSGDSSS
ncbi:UPF0687 protein C20orf27 homolog [Diaphorina citri]|uniref:Adipose-secreted signaling protein n=1 Tax=Diaphorina citri TaxID=121845 RepID=A0A1S3D036_DIACI|nr:UPF0687 protein C20orf27 homolog [Diaphorina citri]KAI5706559.1 hypothetical protein M8J75_009343 [Diaphorina citri]KAI5740382.1 hypothetical protein M8J76_003205 [Diaphorina citri]KAI5741796.1 hypothetical protein M8J76_017130 [Diaphorina citri]KAI5746381.1 hypothetical protein M8J77_003006 [Diaphorina citri]